MSASEVERGSGRCDSRTGSPADGATGFAVAAWASPVVLVSVLGALIVQGHDGLALTLGLAGAAFLAIALPTFGGAVHANATELPGLLARRHRSATVGVIAALLLGGALALLLAAEMSAAASLFSLWSQSSAWGYPIALVLTAAGGLAGAFGHVRPGAGIGIVMIALAALVFALVALAGRDGPGALVSIPAMADIAALELSLLEKRLADPATFKPHAVPFLKTDAVNFASLVVPVAMGGWLMFGAWAGGRAGESRDRRGLVWAIVLLALLPPVAVAAKRATLAWVASGVKAAELPSWTLAIRDAGLVSLCGGDPAVIGPTAGAIKACGKGVGPQGLLRVQDLVFLPDAALQAGLDAGTGFAGWIGGLVLLAVVGGLLLVAARVASAIVSAARSVGSGVVAARVAAVLAVIAASAIAYAPPADAAGMLVWACTLAAAALGPVALAGLAADRRARSAALLAMVIGAVVPLGALASARYAPVALFSATAPMSSAAPTVHRKLASLRATMADVAEGPGRATLAQQAEKLARDNLVWAGLRPTASGALGVLIGLAIMAVGTILASVVARVRG